MDIEGIQDKALGVLVDLAENTAVENHTRLQAAQTLLAHVDQQLWRQNSIGGTNTATGEAQALAVKYARR